MWKNIVQNILDLIKKYLNTNEKIYTLYICKNWSFLSKYEEVEFENICTNEKFLETLINMQKSSIRSFTIESQQIKNNYVCDILSILPNLQYLNLYNYPWTNVQIIQQIMKLENLIYVSLGINDDILENGMQYLEKIKSLQKIDFGYCKMNAVTDNHMRYLWNVVGIQSLALFAEDLLITDKGMVEILGMKNLKELCIIDCKYLTNDAIRHLTLLQSLEKIELISCDYFDEHCLSYLFKMSNLQSISIDNCNNFGNIALQYLSEMYWLKHLTFTELKTSEGLYYLNKLDALESLNISGCKYIMVEGLKIISNLKSLRNINLSYCEITDNHLLQITDQQKIEKIYLNSCYKITDIGLSYLSKLQNLQTLELSYCNNITDNGLLHLTNLQNLKKIHLISCYQITNKGLQYLCDNVEIVGK